MGNKFRIIVLVFMVLFYFTISIPILINFNLLYWITGILFLVTMIIVVNLLLKEINSKKNLIFLFLFIYLFIYMTFSMLNFLSSDISTISLYFKIVLLLVLGIIAFFKGITFTKKLKINSFKNINYEPKIWVYLIFLTCTFFVFFIKIYFSGGLINYLTSEYQDKYGSSFLENIIYIMEKFINPFTFYNLFFINYKKNNIIRIISRLFFAINIIMIYGAGASLSILFQIIGLITVQFFSNPNNFNITLSKHQIKVFFRSICLIFIGVAIAVLIRFNRGTEGFTLAVLKNSYSLLINTSTFDSLYYFGRVISELSPQFTIEQFIYPFIFLLPSSIFSFKPVALGKLVAVLFKDFTLDSNAGYGVTPMAEFYYDFGIIGIIVGMFIVGCIIGYINRKIINCSNPRLCIVLIVMFMIPTVSLATSWASTGSNLLCTFIFVLIVSYFNKYTIKF